MIILKRSLVDIAAAYQQIYLFNQTLKDTWLPGFIRSYERRQAAYLNSINRYENRHWLWRLLFKSPKPPRRLPNDIYNKITQKLWEDWIGSMRMQIEDEAVDQDKKNILNTLNYRLNDQYFILTGIHPQGKETNKTIVVSSSGSWIVCLEKESELCIRSWDEPAKSLETSPFTKQLEMSDDEKMGVFLKIDELLAFHQSIVPEETISALQDANRLINREKDYLLRLAANL